MEDSGATLVEVLLVVAILGIMLGIAALWLRPLEAPLESATVLLDGFLRQTRARAMATTSTYRVSAQDTGRAIAESGGSCAGTTWTPDPSLQLELPRGVAFDATDWSVCIGPRGTSPDNVVIALSQGPRTAGVEVLLGGTTRVHR